MKAGKRKTDIGDPIRLFERQAMLRELDQMRSRHNRFSDGPKEPARVTRARAIVNEYDRQRDERREALWRAHQAVISKARQVVLTAERRRDIAAAIAKVHASAARNGGTEL